MAVIKTVLHEFRMGDVEDPELYAAAPLYEWQKSEVGQWCMEHCVEAPSFNVGTDMHHYGFKITVVGILKEQDYTYWRLKYEP